MKRITLLCVMMMVVVVTNAQMSKHIVVTESQAISEFTVSLNLANIAESLEADQGEYGSVIAQWVNPNHDRSQQWESWTNISIENNPQTDGIRHWRYAFDVITTENRILVSMASNESVWGDNIVKAGSSYNLKLVFEYKGKTTSYDLNIDVLGNSSMHQIPLASFQKVGEGSMNLKWAAGAKNEFPIDLETISKSLGGNTHGGNLSLYVYSDKEKQQLTDYFAYDFIYTATVDRNFVASLDPNSGSTAMYISLDPSLNTIRVSTVNVKFESGTSLSGPVFLVADDKYYELTLNIQFGQEDEEAQNMATIAAAHIAGEFSKKITKGALNNGIENERIEASPTFRLSTLAKAMGVDTDELKTALVSWLSAERVDGEYDTPMIYNLSDNASTAYSGGRGGFRVNQDGTIGGPLSVRMQVNSITDELEVTMGGNLAKGDEYSVLLGLYYKGELVKLNLTFTVGDQDGGELFALEDMKKVGEQIISGQYKSRMTILLDLDEKAKSFSIPVKGKSLKLYVMDDASRQLLTDRYSNEVLPQAILDMEGINRNDTARAERFEVFYSPYQDEMAIRPRYASNGIQHTSGSVYLVAEDEYYELILDVAFGSEYSTLGFLASKATQAVNVELMTTDSYFTHYDSETKQYSLVSSKIDMPLVESFIGTDQPVLYAEQKLDGGSLVFSNNYTAIPAQGFWMKQSGDGFAYICDFTNDASVGVYFADGELRWYEIPRRPKAGDTCKFNLYLVNPKNMSSVKILVTVTYKDKLSGSVPHHVVRRLPYGMTAGDDASAIGNLTPTLSEGEGVVYNLSGQRLNVPQRGLNIVDGKKVFIK